MWLFYFPFNGRKFWNISIKHIRIFFIKLSFSWWCQLESHIILSDPQTSVRVPRVPTHGQNISSIGASQLATSLRKNTRMWLYDEEYRAIANQDHRRAAKKPSPYGIEIASWKQVQVLRVQWRTNWKSTKRTFILSPSFYTINVNSHLFDVHYLRWILWNSYIIMH
jgi:hypothetical protein